jgi:hypothetical protein
VGSLKYRKATVVYIESIDGEFLEEQKALTAEALGARMLFLFK